MPSTNSRIDKLQRMLSLEEKRADLEQQLNEVIDQMIELRDHLFTEDASSAAETTTASMVAEKVSSPKSKPKKTPRGGLKDKILAALEVAGDAGVRVKELAQAIGTKPVNIHSWFHSTMKRNPSIKKIDGGHYKLQGGAGQQTSPVKSKGAKSASKARKQTTKSGRSGRGEVSTKILEALQSAGADGMSASEIGEKIGSNPRNVSVWFATTGKKNKSVKKVDRGRYRLAK